MTSAKSPDSEHKTYDMLHQGKLVLVPAPDSNVIPRWRSCCCRQSLTLSPSLSVAGQIKGFSAIYTAIIPVP